MAIIFEKYIPSFFPPPTNVESNSSSLLGQSTLILKPYYLLISVGIGPIAEEFFFRGFLYKALSLSWGKVSAGAAVCIVFVLFHYSAFEYWVALMSLLLGSIALLVLREKSGSLIPPILMHQFYNLGAGIWG
jgi:membrane protease YdiL (CAAX protease family)